MAGPAATQHQAPLHHPAQLQRQRQPPELCTQPSAASIAPMLTLQDLGLSLSPEGSPPSQTPDASPRAAQPCQGAASPTGSGAAFDAWQGTGCGAPLYPGQALPWLMSEASALSVGPLLEQQQYSRPGSETSCSSPTSLSQADQAADQSASSHVQQSGHASRSEPSTTPAAAALDQPEDEQQPRRVAGTSSGLQPDGAEGMRSVQATESTAQHLLRPDQALHWLSAELSAVSVQPVLSPGSGHSQISDAESLDPEEGITSEVIF